MLREFLTIFVPLVLPTAVYLLWLWVVRWMEGGARVRWAALPWVWLAGTGALLLAVVLFVVRVSLDTSQPGVYVPPRWENGKIIPGHIEPGRGP